jgi:hypothetical protein
MASIPADGLEITGVPQAIASNTRRENIVGESGTEFTLRNTLYAR